MKKKLFIIFLTVCMAIVAMTVSPFAEDITTDTTWYNTTDTTFTLYDAADLAGLASLVNAGTDNFSGKTIVLGNSIDLNNEEWTPIGTSSARFEGTFDGKGYTISNLYIYYDINEEEISYQGLFGYVGTTGTVKNVEVNGTVTASLYVGGIIGCNRGIVSSCCYNGSIFGKHYVGGVVGYNSGTVEECCSSGTFNGTLGNIGGITGAVENGKVQNCYSSCSVSSNTGYSTIGGIVGRVISSTVHNCYCLSSTAYSAVGENYSDSGTVTSTASVTVDEFASGEVAYLLNNGVTNGTQAWYQTLGTDSYPVLDSTHGTVYYGTNCAGTAIYSNSTVPVAEHNYDTGVVRKEVTCTEDGEITYTCSVCGDSYTEEIVATGHTAGEPTVENEVSATCTKDGSYDIVVFCTECGEEISRETITVSATGHTYVDIVTAPTCTEKGYTTYTCSICGDYYTADEVEATGHSYEAVVTDPTCTEQGYTTYTCSVCGDSYTADETEATGHNYEAVVTEPTCTEKGYTTYTCTEGDNSYVDDYTDALGHTTEIQNAKDATCTEDGYTGDEVCTVCGETVTAGKVIPATGHNYEAVVTEPTCTEKGYTTYTCKVCGDSYTADETEATGHSWDEGVVTTEATCTEDGVKTYTCTICGESYEEEIPATDHAWGETAYTWNEDGSSCTATHTCENDSSHVEEATATIVSEQTLEPTCTEKGETTYTATFSEDWAEAQTLTVADVDATGHTYGEPVFTWNGNTCTATFTCTECDDEQTVDATVTSKNFFGMVTRTAEVTFGGSTYTDTKTTGRSLLTIMADYTSVNNAIAKANALNASDYSNFADVTAAINAVQWNLNVLNQSTVNGYAEAIETAISNLKTAELTEETVTINEPIEDTNTSTEPDDIEVDDTDEETNPTTGIALAMLPMAIALAATVAGKRR